MNIANLACKNTLKRIIVRESFEMCRASIDRYSCGHEKYFGHWPCATKLRHIEGSLNSCEKEVEYAELAGKCIHCIEKEWDRIRKEVMK